MRTGIFPALILAALFVVLIVGLSLYNPAWAPDDSGAEMPLWERWKPFVVYVVPLSLIFVAVIGSLLTGIASPTDAAALGCLAALVASIAYRSLTLASLATAIMETVKLTVMIMFIIAASQTFSQILAFSGATGGMIGLINSWSLGPLAILLGMIVILLMLGCFIDQVSMLMVTIPIFMPLSHAVGIDPLLLGVVYLLTMEIALLTPPFGLLLFVIAGVAPDGVTMSHVYRAAAPFVLIKLIVLGLIVWMPEIGTWLPRKLSG